jgi:hypothetical protein
VLDGIFIIFYIHYSGSIQDHTCHCTCSTIVLHNVASVIKENKESPGMLKVPPPLYEAWYQHAFELCNFDIGELLN